MWKTLLPGGPVCQGVTLSIRPALLAYRYTRAALSCRSERLNWAFLFLSFASVPICLARFRAKENQHHPADHRKKV